MPGGCPPGCGRNQRDDQHKTVWFEKHNSNAFYLLDAFLALFGLHSYWTDCLLVLHYYSIQN